MKFLTERKAEPISSSVPPAISAAARVWSQFPIPKPKIARLSTTHVDGDFGDTLGMDIAYWKNSRGKMFMFTHVICEHTLFHMAAAVGRTPEEQFEALASGRSMVLFRRDPPTYLPGNTHQRIGRHNFRKRTFEPRSAQERRTGS